MASIVPIKGKYRVQVRRTGQPTLTKTFDTEKQAKTWAAKIESDIDAGKKVGIHGKTGMTIADAVDRYLSEKKDMSDTTVDILGYIKKGLGKLHLDKITDDDIVSYIQKKKFSPASGAMHFSYIRSLLKMAKVGWSYHVPEILDHARDRLKILNLIGASKERDRRPTEEEIEKLVNYKYPTEIPMADIIKFAISTAMRQAEITRIKRNTLNVAHKTIVITDRKHPTKKIGNNKVVPLLDEALKIIQRQKEDKFNDCIFPFAPTTIGDHFRDACFALGIENLHFHDLRHEATSRLFEMGYQIHEVAMFTGHEDWKQLRRYTQLKAKDIRRLEEPELNQLEGMDAETLKQFKQFQAMLTMMNQQKAA